MTGKLLLGAIVFCSALPLWADCKISVSSNPPLPMKNLIRNFSFEAGGKFWKKSSAAEGTKNSSVASEAFDGKSCWLMAGNGEANINICQRLHFNPVLPKGTVLTFKVHNRFDGEADFELPAPGSNLQVYFTDKKSKYLPAPSFVKDPHDWLERSQINTLPNDTEKINVYLGFSKHDGDCYWDDVELYAGIPKISFEINCPEIKEVKVYGREEGLILKKEFDRPQNNFAADFSGSPISTYVIEVMDENGARYSLRYPENGHLPIVEKGDCAVGQRFDVDVIQKDTSEIFTFNLPAKPKGKTVLQLQARLHSKDYVRGYASSLSVFMNGTHIKKNRLLYRDVEFTRANGALGNVWSSNAFNVFYSPGFFPLSTENIYCPVSYEDRNPFTFRLDISDLVKEGKNELRIANTCRGNVKKMDLYIKHCAVKFE